MEKHHLTRSSAALMWLALSALAFGCRSEQRVPLSAGGVRNTSFVDGVDPNRCPTTPAGPGKAAGEPCACDIQCESRTCAAGVCCAGGACSVQRPLGIACLMGEQCRSGFCADGVCCNVACTGACVACNRPDQMGQCATVPAGSEDRHGGCRRDPPETCGQTGLCNGEGGCARQPSGTVCAEAACIDRDHFLAASRCDGEGTCRSAAPVSCSPSTCAEGSCLESCSGDVLCAAPFTCVAGSCGPKGLGQDCQSGGQCGSGSCVDGVCCESACAGRCRFCASAEARGRCRPVEAGLLDPRAARGDTDPNLICQEQGPETCGSNGRCDGQGGCQRYPDGTICAPALCESASNSETPAATCAGGGCRQPGSRSCAPYLGCSGAHCRTSCASDAQCAAGGVCLAGDCGRRPNGALCTRGTDCTSDVCAQGRCCAAACTGTCRSCALPGQEGTCANVPVGAPDPSGTCRDDACGNACDGSGGCRRENPGTVCGPARCTGGNAVSRVCNAGGACEDRTTVCGLLQVCTDGRCVVPVLPPPPPPSPPPAPAPAPPAPTARFFVDTFAPANGYRTPFCSRSPDPACRPVGRLFAATNYVFCKTFGDEVRVGVDFNHWWLLTDLDERVPGFSGRAYVSAYYLTRWGNDVARDNAGRDIPNCP